MAFPSAIESSESSCIVRVMEQIWKDLCIGPFQLLLRFNLAGLPTQGVIRAVQANL